MSAEKLFQIMRKNLKTMILVGMLLGASSFLFLVVSQKNFRSKTDILIVQNQAGNADLFTLSKSSEYVTSVLSEAIYSERFLGEVKDTGIITNEFVSSNKAQKLKDWKKIVKIKKSAISGMASIEIFADSQKQAEEISAAVLSVLENKSSDYLGTGQSVEVKVLSGPIVEKNPSLAQISLVILGGLAVGTIMVFFWAVLAEAIKAEEKNQPVFMDDKNQEGAEEGRIMSFKEAQPMIETEDYFAPDSDYWKKRLNSLK